MECSTESTILTRTLLPTAHQLEKKTKNTDIGADMSYIKPYKYNLCNKVCILKKIKMSRIYVFSFPTLTACIAPFK